MKKAKLTPKQEATIIALLERGTIEEAANKVGVTRQTIHTWLREVPEFKRRLEVERKAVFDEAAGLIKTASRQAAAVMINLLDHRDSRTRIRAAKDILGYAIKTIELSDIEERLDRIEAALGNKGRL